MGTIIQPQGGLIGDGASWKTRKKMTDPYGRTKMPTEPKAPRYFRPFTPFKVFIWAWFWCMHATFKGYWTSWKENEREWYAPALMLFIATILPAQIGSVVLISHYAFGVIGWWLWVAVLGFYLVHLLFFFAFHLHTDEGFQHWKDKLLD